MIDVKLSDIWYDSANKEIRVDWSNDRHFALRLESQSYEDVARALHKVIAMIYQEERND